MQFKTSILLAVVAVSLSSTRFSLAASTMQARAEGNGDDMRVPWLVRSYDDVTGAADATQDQLLSATMPGGAQVLSQNTKRTGQEPRHMDQFQALSPLQAWKECAGYAYMRRDPTVGIHKCKDASLSAAECAYQVQHARAKPIPTAQTPMNPSGLSSLYIDGLNNGAAVVSCAWIGEGPSYISDAKLAKMGAKAANVPNQGQGYDTQFIQAPKGKDLDPIVTEFYEGCPLKFCELTQSLSSSQDDHWRSG